MFTSAGRIASATVLAVVLAGVAALPASAKAAPVPIPSAAALAAALSAKGLGCTSLTALPKRNGSASRAKCDTLAGEAGVSVSVYSTNASLKKNYSAFIKDLCQPFHKAGIHGQFVVVTGPNWAIVEGDGTSFAQAKATGADSLASGMNAKENQVSC